MLIDNPEWQPMRTAPKGRPVVVRVPVLPDNDPANDTVTVAFWNHVDRIWQQSGAAVVSAIYPTLWAPIPAFFIEATNAA